MIYTLTRIRLMRQSSNVPARVNKHATHADAAVTAPACHAISSVTVKELRIVGTGILGYMTS